MHIGQSRAFSLELAGPVNIRSSPLSWEPAHPAKCKRNHQAHRTSNFPGAMTQGSLHLWRATCQTAAQQPLTQRQEIERMKSRPSQHSPHGFMSHISSATRHVPSTFLRK